MDRTEYLLTCLAEECSEVAQRCSKAIRFGLDEVQPGQDHSNAERLAQELDDLVGVAKMLRAATTLRDPSWRDQERKAAKVEKYAAYSRQLGRLS